MPAPPIMTDLGSGINSQKVIKQLMELEKQPLLRLEEDNKKNGVMVEAWEAARKRTMTLQEKSRILYSFAGPFATRKVVSSDPGAITGEASASAKDLSQEIQVKQLATAHQIHSDEIEKERDLPAADFVIHVGEKTVGFHFSGGKIHDLVKLIQSKGEGLYELYSVQVDGEHVLVGMRSLLEGKKGEIQFEDDGGILRSIGLASSEMAKSWKDMKFAEADLTPVNPSASKAVDRGYNVREEGRALLIARGRSVVWKSSLQKGERIHFQWSGDGDIYTGPDAGEGGKESATPAGHGNASGSIPATVGKQPDSEKGEMSHESVLVGPGISVDVGDVHLEGYQIERERDVLRSRAGQGLDSSLNTDKTSNGSERGGSETSGTSRNADSLTLFWRENGVAKSRHVPVSPGRISIDVNLATGGYPVDSIRFNSRNEQGARISSPAKESIKDGKSRLAAHENHPAQDAKLVINGIEVTRPSNRGLTDLMEGASLELHRVTNGPIKVTVEANTEEIIANIKDWVTAYNDLLKFLRENSRAATEDEFKKARPAGDTKIGDGLDAMDLVKGIFAADSTVRQLIGDMRFVTSSAYPSRTKPSYRVLNDIGITTGKPGESWETIKHGYLMVDETRLKEAILRSPDGVKELFVSDQNADNRFDNGVAFRMAETMKPYTRSSGGLISVRIDLLKLKIADNKQRMDRMQLSLKSKEEQLRIKFGAMESAINSSKETGKYLKNNLPRN